MNSTNLKESRKKKVSPEFLRKYFWEINFYKFNPEKRPEYTIERLLEYGNFEALRWMFRTFPEEKIKEVLKTTRALSLRSANFWGIYFDFKKENIRCLRKQFRQTYRAIWPY